jgi:hypothetical protein
METMQRQLAALQLVILHGHRNLGGIDAATQTDDDVMKLGLVLFERHGDVDAHLADQWNYGPCDDQEWQQMQEAALREFGEFTARLPAARLGLTGLDALTPTEVAMYEADGEFGEVFWHAMHEVFGPTVEEEEEEDSDNNDNNGDEDDDNYVPRDRSNGYAPVPNAPSFDCVICHNTITGQYGNNASPLAEGQCCDACNASHVLPARFQAWRAGIDEDPI